MEAGAPGLRHDVRARGVDHRPARGSSGGVAAAAELLLAQEVDGDLRRRALDRPRLRADLADAVPGHRVGREQAVERSVGDVGEAVLQTELVTQRLLAHLATETPGPTVRVHVPRR